MLHVLNRLTPYARILDRSSSFALRLIPDPPLPLSGSNTFAVGPAISGRSASGRPVNCSIGSRRFGCRHKKRARTYPWQSLGQNLEIRALVFQGKQHMR